MPRIICKIELMCILITYLSPVFMEVTKMHDSSTTSYVSAYGHEKDDSSETKFDGLQDVGRKWKSMESWTKKWFNAIYNESLPFLKHVNDYLDISRTCKRDLRKMLEGINQNKRWAVQMLDSFGHLPAGIGSGTISSLGDYDLCLDVNVPDSFQGQYCNLDFTLPMPEGTHYVRSKNIEEIAKVLQEDGYFASFKEHFNLFYLLGLRSAICVPSTCSKDELQKIATAVAQKMDLSLTPNIPNCEVMKKEVKFDRVEITVMIILGILLFLVISSTALELFYLKTANQNQENVKRNLSSPIKYLLCFSLYTNSKELLKQDTQKDSLKVFYGIRFLNTLWVIVLHLVVFGNYRATSSLLYASKIFKKVPFYFLANSILVNHTFFFMSNVLHAFNAMKKNERINVKKHIVQRIWRLAPPFLLVIACVTLIHHLGSGPIWKETVTEYSENCRATWWTNLLFINNFIGTNVMCLDWLWFIAVDFHMYVLSLLVLIPMKKNPRLAFTINVFMMIGANTIYAASYLYYELQPVAVLKLEDSVSRLRLVEFLELGYFPTYVHMSSACIGLAVGYFLTIKPSTLHISKKISMTLWLASPSVCLALILGAYIWSGGNLPSAGVSTMYVVVSKILWNAAMAWITIACMTGNGGIVSDFLSLPIFVPLGKLCYMTLLIHPIIRLMYIGSTRSVLNLDIRTCAYAFGGLFFLSFSCAFCLTLLFELPFVALGKLMFAGKTSERTKMTKELAKENTENASSKDGCITEEGNSDKKIA